MIESGERYYTVAEVASRFRISKMTVYRACEEGRLGYIRIASVVRISEKALEEFIENSQENYGGSMQRLERLIRSIKEIVPEELDTRDLLNNQQVIDQVRELLYGGNK